MYVFCVSACLCVFCVGVWVCERVRVRVWAKTALKGDA